MGGGTFDVSSSAARSAVRASTGASAFTHDADARAGKAPMLHPSLDFSKKPQREARDNDDNPTTTPIAVLCDVTGSMREIPAYVIKELHKLMGLILDEGVVSCPTILFGAIGDCTSDSVPVQVGEFESDDELAEAHLSNIYLEGCGGGQHMESYELFLWLFANRVHTDAWEKRGEKGLLFIIGDEAPYPHVNRRHVEKYLGIDTTPKVPADLLEKAKEWQTDTYPLEQVAKDVQDKWEVFLIRPADTCHFNDPMVKEAWGAILPEERIIEARKREEIVPYIAGTISVMAGMSVADTIAALKNHGFDASAIHGAANSLMPLENTTVPLVAQDTALVGADGDAVAHGERL